MPKEREKKEETKERDVKTERDDSRKKFQEKERPSERFVQRKSCPQKVLSIDRGINKKVVKRAKRKVFGRIRSFLRTFYRHVLSS